MTTKVDKFLKKALDKMFQAVGIIALVMMGKTVENALSYVLSIRPQAWPNLRMLRFASNTLGQDLCTPVKKWKEENETSIYIPQGGWSL